MHSASLLVEGLGGRTLCLDVGAQVTVHEVKALISDACGVPVSLQRLSLCSKPLRDASVLRDCSNLPPLRLSLGLLGGKGGFGSMLRSAKARVSVHCVVCCVECFF